MRKDRDIRVVGFDCAEEKHAVVLLDSEGGLERKMSVENAREQVQDCLAQLLLVVGSGSELIVVVESARSHGRLVADEAAKLGCEVMKVNTVALNRFREVEGQPRKSDEWDAYLAAKMAFLDLKGCRTVVPTSQEERALSRLTRSHQRLRKERTQHVARLRAVLLELAPEMLHRSWKGPKPGSQALKYLLQRWPGFQGLEKAQLPSIEKILRRCRYGDSARPVAELLRDMARRISLEREDRLAVTLDLEALVRQITLCDELLDDIDRKIEECVQQHPIAVKLCEMVGIGAITAGTLASELLPVARTATEAESATYAGVTPIGRITGKGKERASMAQGVNKHVLNALYTSAVAAIKCSAIDRAYYEKKLRDYSGHRVPHIAAFIALSRQRHKVIFKLMTTDERYDKEKLIARHLERLAAERNRAA